MILAIVIALIVFGVSLKRPTWGLAIILATLPTYLIRFNLLNVPTTLLEIMVGAFLLAVFFSHWNIEAFKKIKKLGTVNWAILAFLIAAIISTFVSPDFSRALGQLKAFFIEPILIFYACVVILDNKNHQLPLRALFWSAFAISLFGLVQYWTNLILPLRFWGYGNEDVKRITSVFEYPNALALFLAPIFIFFHSLVASGKKVAGKYWTFIGLGVMSVAIVLTYSRGAWIAVFVAAVAILVRHSRFSLKKLSIITVVALILVSPIIYSRFKGTVHDRSSGERVELYKVALQEISSEPVFGNGLYGFRSTLQASKYSGEVLNYPHNIFLNFWLETGLLGVLSFALIIFLALSKYKSKPDAVKLAAALFLFTFVIHGMVDVPYFKNDLSLLFWFMTSLFYID